MTTISQEQVLTSFPAQLLSHFSAACWTSSCSSLLQPCVLPTFPSDVDRAGSAMGFPLLSLATVDWRKFQHLSNLLHLTDTHEACRGVWGGGGGEIYRRPRKKLVFFVLLREPVFLWTRLCHILHLQNEHDYLRLSSIAVWLTTCIFLGSHAYHIRPNCFL